MVSFLAPIVIPLTLSTSFIIIIMLPKAFLALQVIDEALWLILKQLFYSIRTVHLFFNILFFLKTFLAPIIIEVTLMWLIYRLLFLFQENFPLFKWNTRWIECGSYYLNGSTMILVLFICCGRLVSCVLFSIFCCDNLISCIFQILIANIIIWNFLN